MNAVDVKMVDAKRNLLHLIISKKSEDLTDNEVELGWLLTKDKDIQELLERRMKDDKKN